MNRLVTATVLAAGLLSAQPAMASALPAQEPRAASRVTIEAMNLEMSGTLRSVLRVCKHERKVLVVQQKGERGGGDDVVRFSDVSQVSDGVGEWSTGNTGEPGRFYAKVRRTEQCAGDTSRTIRVQQEGLRHSR